MSALVGNLSLSLSVLTAALALMTAIVSAKFGSAALLRAARWMIAGYFVLITISSIALIVALVGSDFSIDYVVHYTEKALPFGYKLAAFWAGQDGSLLLWAWALSGMCVIYLFGRRHESGREVAAVVATLAFVIGFFATLMLVAANPFAASPEVVTDGYGLNPMLQHPAMIAHPPMLFLGYAGFTIPFAALVGALIAGRRDNEWIGHTRRWSIASWLFLSIGILLGAQWAYVELGWGGYWAWDPVENASLLPWLTGTALLHSIMVQQHRGMLKSWNAWLIAATFVLCIFGTYLTRSGVVSSVHSFGESLVGTLFLAFLVVTILFSVALILARRRVLRSEHEIENLLGREGFFLATNVLLVFMAAMTLLGTIFPVISRTISDHEVTVGAAFYNKVVAPLGLLLAALMAVGPLLSYGPEATRKLIRGLILPAAIAALAVSVFVAQGVHNTWALIAVAIVASALANVLIDLTKTIFAHARTHHENPLLAAVRVFDANHRRYGGQIVHTGIVMIIAGVTGSSLFSQKETIELKPGATASFAGQTVQLVSLEQVRHENYTAIQANVTLTDANGVVRTFQPERRFFDKAEEPSSAVAIRSDFKRDYYLTLAGWEDSGSTVAIEAIVNPLVAWIWAGGIVLALGGTVCLLPRFSSTAAVHPMPVAMPRRINGSRRTIKQERIHETV
jgi:cytochrome c-type biogenesis protein CcmF